MEISRRIRQAVEKQGLSLSDFCAKTGVKYRTLQNYLEGRSPSADFLIVLNNHYNISINSPQVPIG